MVRDNFLQLNSFLQLPDERIEKMGFPIAVIYAVRDKARASANQLTPTSSSNTPASTPSTSVSTPVRRAVITPESILTSTPATLDELKKLTSKINPEVDSHKLKLASIVCAKMVEVGFKKFFLSLIWKAINMTSICAFFSPQVFFQLHGIKPSTEIKCLYAQMCVELFPTYLVQGQKYPYVSSFIKFTKGQCYSPDIFFRDCSFNRLTKLPNTLSCLSQEYLSIS